jgi:hypothetical protein
VSIATLQGLLEVEDFKVASKAFTEIVAFNCLKVMSEVYNVDSTSYAARTLKSENYILVQDIPLKSPPPPKFS